MIKLSDDQIIDLIIKSSMEKDYAACPFGKGKKDITVSCLNNWYNRVTCGFEQMGDWLN